MFRAATHLMLRRLGLASVPNATPSTGIEREREEAKALLSTWLRDVPGKPLFFLVGFAFSDARAVPADTFILVTGPKGSGKTILVEEVLSDAR